MSKSQTVSKPRNDMRQTKKKKTITLQDDRSPFIIAGEALANHPGWEYFWEGYHDFKRRLKVEDAEE